jgi:hypothetical protein
VTLRQKGKCQKVYDACVAAIAKAKALGWKIPADLDPVNAEG